MDHPDIKRVQQQGYLDMCEPMLDELGNQMYPGDDIYIYDDMYFSIAHLTSDAIEILESINAVKTQLSNYNT